MSRKVHWERVYSSKPVDRLGWYEPRLQTSLAWISQCTLPADAPVIDIGGGASTLVDDLLEANYRDITVLDISEEALFLARNRLGEDAALVTWLNGDITSVDLPKHHYELWHDRAVFHFLTEEEDRQKYRKNLMRSLKPSGHVIIGTFALEAPPKCSGLPVQRYTEKQLADTLGHEFDLRRHQKEMHTTPGGLEQMYLYCHFRRKD